MRRIFLVVSHSLALAIGFALGIYLLPILTAPKGPDMATLKAGAQDAMFSAQLRRDLSGSDFLHWGDGTVSVSSKQIVHIGKLAPGPDYKLYLVPKFVEDAVGFLAVKSQSAQVGEVNSFGGFILSVPDSIDVSAFDTVLVWCEAFGVFITAAQYQ